MMNRRNFLRLLGIGAAGVALAPELVLDPERALWIPGQRTIFLPSEPGPFHGPHPPKGHRARMRREALYGPGGGNTILTISMITQEALRILENNLAFTKRINRQYDEHFSGVQVGRNIAIRTPIRFNDALLIGGQA
jgi:hypothetical protein